MKKITDREEELKKDFNAFWEKHLKSIPDQNDFYNELGIEGVLKLKNVVSSINNIITLKTTLCFVKGISGLLRADFSKMKTKVEEQNANANGFDFYYTGEDYKIVAEVKCNIPCGRDNMAFGSQQKEGIISDLEHLLKGKPNYPTDGFYKFMVLLEVGKGAMDKLLTTSPQKNVSNDSFAKRIDRMKSQLDTQYLHVSDLPQPLDINNVYVVYVSPQELVEYKEES